MSEWKKVKVDFKTIKLGDYIEPIKATVAEKDMKNPVVYGVTNKEGIVQTGKPASKDISNYIVLEENCFAFNPYRINVGSIGINDNNLTGCVSPAYVVFKTKNGLLPKFLFFYLKSDYGNHLINWYGNRGGVRNALRYSDLCNIDIPDIRNINQELLLKKFSSVSETINQIRLELEIQKIYVKQLRQNILQDAIEGKLTADWRKSHPVIKGNPDYDAEALFEKIQKEKSHGEFANANRLTAISKRKVRSLDRTALAENPCDNEENPFEIPDGWKWVKIEDLGRIFRGSGITRSDMIEKGKPVVRYGELYTTYGLQFSKTISFISDDLFRKSKIFPKNTVIFTLTGENRQDIAKASAYLGDESVAASGDLACWINHNQEPLYLSYFMASRYFLNEKIKIATGDFIIHISAEKLKSVAFPLPPLKEQEEIVTKVENLLAKVTELENQIQERKTLSEKLAFGIIKEKLEG